LVSIVAKCLQTEPENRYARAIELAEDLRRHMNDLPLRHVPNRSLSERWLKWRRRRPLAFPLIGLLASAIIALAVYSDRSIKQADRARLALRSGDDLLQSQRYDEAIAEFRQGETLTEALPFSGNVSARLQIRRSLAERARAAIELHRWCDRVRPLYGNESHSAEQNRAILSHCRSFWDQRLTIAQQLAEQPTKQLREQVRADLLDLAIVMVDLQLRVAAPAELAEARREARALLEDAERLFGTSCVLEEERSNLEKTISGGAVPCPADSRRAVDRTPRTAWEHFALGRALFRQGQIAAAEKEMDCALGLEPGALWANYWKGNCAYRLERPQDAVVAFSACVALAPEMAWCYGNRGLAYAELGQTERALGDYERALKLDPGLVSALRGRGLIHYRMHRYAEALADFHTCLGLGADRAGTCADIAMVHLANGERTEARSWATKVFEVDPRNKHALGILSRLGTNQ
jgi:tetratricopeptide (TPR) repeat protein